LEGYFYTDQSAWSIYRVIINSFHPMPGDSQNTKHQAQLMVI